MSVCANTSNSKSPRASRYNTRSSHRNKEDSGAAHCPPISVPPTLSPAPAPDPKEVFRSRYYAHLTAKKDIPRIKPTLAEPNAGVPVAPVAVPSSQHGTCQQPTTEQKVQEFRQRHRRLQEEKQEMEENERAAKAREFKKRWERVNKGGKVACADAYENSSAEGWFEVGSINGSSSSTERYLSSSFLPTSFSSERSTPPSSLPPSMVQCSPSPYCDELFENVENRMSVEEWKEYRQWIRGYVLYSKEFTPSQLDDAFDRAERLHVCFHEPADSERRRRSTIG